MSFTIITRIERQSATVCLRKYRKIKTRYYKRCPKRKYCDIRRDIRSKFKNIPVQNFIDLSKTEQTNRAKRIILKVQ